LENIKVFRKNPRSDAGIFVVAKVIFSPLYLAIQNAAVMTDETINEIHEMTKGIFRKRGWEKEDDVDEIRRQLFEIQSKLKKDFPEDAALLENKIKKISFANETRKRFEVIDDAVKTIFSILNKC
jgi:hypothetical protein